MRTLAILLFACAAALAQTTCVNCPGSASAPSGSAGGDLSGTYPNPTVATINGSSPATVATTGSASDLGTGTLPAGRLPAFTGDVSKSSGSAATTVTAINGTALSGLATGLLKNTTTTGVPTIATAGTDYATPNATVNAQTGTSYTLQSSDNGKVLTLSNVGAITLTVPSGLGAGFNCLIIQLAAGNVTPTASSTTINQRQSFTKTAGQYAVATLAAYATDTFVLSGDLQ